MQRAYECLHSSQFHQGQQEAPRSSLIGDFVPISAAPGGQFAAKQDWDLTKAPPKPADKWAGGPRLANAVGGQVGGGRWREDERDKPPVRRDGDRCVYGCSSRLDGGPSATAEAACPSTRQSAPRSLLDSCSCSQVGQRRGGQRGRMGRRSTGDSLLSLR
jgi:hypothetical protein